MYKALQISKNYYMSSRNRNSLGSVLAIEHPPKPVSNMLKPSDQVLDMIATTQQILSERMQEQSRLHYENHIQENKAEAERLRTELAGIRAEVQAAKEELFAKARANYIKLGSEGKFTDGIKSRLERNANQSLSLAALRTGRNGADALKEADAEWKQIVRSQPKGSLAL